LASLVSRLTDLITAIGADVKALQSSDWMPTGGLLWVPGRYYGSSMFGTTTTLAATANRLYLTPFRVTKARNIDRLSFNVTVAGTVARAGIWNADADGFPTTVLYDPGASIAINTTGLKEHSGTVALAAGLKWLGLVATGTPTFSAFSTAMIPFVAGGTTFGGGVIAVGKDAVDPAVALPTMVGQTLSYGSTSTPPLVQVRAA
jgi:hypothetical protein